MVVHPYFVSVLSEFSCRFCFSRIQYSYSSSIDSTILSRAESSNELDSSVRSKDN